MRGAQQLKGYWKYQLAEIAPRVVCVALPTHIDKQNVAAQLGSYINISHYQVIARMRS